MEVVVKPLDAVGVDVATPELVSGVLGHRGAQHSARAAAKIEDAQSGRGQVGGQKQSR
jgi:hypothetical protein